MLIMELMYTMLTLFLFPISLLLTTLFSRKHNNNKNLPPGKRGWPVIGESLEFVRYGRRGSLDKFFSERTLRYSSQIFKTSLFGEHLTVLCGAEGNKLLFSTESQRVGSWWPSAFEKIFPNGMSEKDRPNEESLRRRRLIAGLFKPEQLKKHVGTMDAVAMQLVQNMIQEPHVVAFYPLAKRYTFEVACKVLLSVEDPHRIAKIYDSFSVLLPRLFSLPINLPGLPMNRAIKASKIIGNEILDIVKKRKIELSSSPTQKNDILFNMLTTSDEIGRFLEEMEIVDVILGLLIAGYDTASIACTSVINYLAEFPQVYQNVYKEQMEITKSKKPRELLKWEDVQKMNYSWNVASEAMRLIPPGPISFRKSLANLTFDGFSIPKATKLLWSPSTTHKDPKYFSEPEKFDPTRFQGNKIVPHSYVPFGNGPRMCPGNEYARLEILVLIHNMVKTFRWEKMFRNEKIIVDPVPRPQNGLSIRLYPH